MNKYKQLTLGQRCEIEVLLGRGKQQKAIGEAIINYERRKKPWLNNRIGVHGSICQTGSSCPPKEKWNDLDTTRLFCLGYTDHSKNGWWVRRAESDGVTQSHAVTTLRPSTILTLKMESGTTQRGHKVSGALSPRLGRYTRLMVCLNF